MKKMELSFGGDPELALFDIKQNKIVSSIPVLKTDKYKPINLGKGIKMYADNVLVEFAFPPSKSSKDLINCYREVFKRAQKKLGSNYRLVPKASHIYDEKELSPAYGIDPQQIGCSPSYNAWSDNPVNETQPFTDGTRTGSSHFHVGNKKICNYTNKIKAVKLLDIFVGCSSVIFDKDPTAKNRRFIYGKSSEHRPTPYGLEYRCLGPYAIINPEITQLVLDLIEYSMEFINNDTADSIINKINPQEVQDAINNCDTDLAKKVLTDAGLPDNFWGRITQEYSTDFYKNWGIKV